MQNSYYELTITLKDDFVEFIADFVSNIYGDGLELAEGKIIVRSEHDLTFVKEALIALEGTLGGSIEMEYFLETKENIDWIKKYQDSVEPIEAGEFYIYPSWYPPKEGVINIKIDPTLAFGSGHHETTFSCLEAISHYVKEDNSVIDVGCGSGILGLASKKLGAKVELCDTDSVSVQSTEDNFKLNHEKFERLWEGSINQSNKQYDVVIANIIVDVLKLLAKGLKSASKPYGIIILSGILDKKESQVLEAYQSLKLLEKIQKNEWVTLIYQNTN